MKIEENICKAWHFVIVGKDYISDYKRKKGMGEDRAKVGKRPTIKAQNSMEKMWKSSLWKEKEAIEEF
jgi:hypothetical protein